MIDFAEINEVARSLHEKLSKRAQTIQSAYSKTPPCFNKIPTDLYDGRTCDAGHSSELEQRFRELTLSYFSREPVLLLDLSNTLKLLNHLQAVWLKKNESLICEDVTEEDALKKIFALAAVREAEKTHALSQAIEQQLQSAVVTVHQFDLETPVEDTDVTKWCLETDNLISDDLTSVAFTDLQNSIYSQACSSLNALASLGLEKIDVELGFLKYCSSDKIDTEIIERKEMVFQSIMGNVSLYLSKSFEWLDAIQLHHNPQSTFSTEPPPSRAKH